MADIKLSRKVLTWYAVDSHYLLRIPGTIWIITVCLLGAVQMRRMEDM